MSASIYRITNKVNGKCYVGQTIQGLEKRWRGHCKASKHGTTYLSNAIQKYGSESFAVELLEETTTEHLNDRERYWIAKLKPAYNMTEGGEGGIPSDEVRDKLRAAKLGKSLSIEHRAKMSASHSGEKNSMYGKRGSDNPNFGRKNTPETIAKMSAARKAYYAKKRMENS